MPTEPRTFAESVDEAEISGRLIVANQSLRALPSFAAIAGFITDISELGECKAAPLDAPWCLTLRE